MSSVKAIVALVEGTEGGGRGGGINVNCDWDESGTGTDSGGGGGSEGTSALLEVAVDGDRGTATEKVGTFAEAGIVAVEGDATLSEVYHAN